jgi:transcriptional regulator with XRE-family HTH domain
MATEEQDGLLTSVARFLTGARRPVAAVESITPASTETPETPLPFAIAIEGMSIEQIAELLKVSDSEVVRLEQALPQEKARADAAFAMRNTAGLQQAWDAEQQLNERLDAERTRQRLLRERLDELTHGEVAGINNTVRQRAEAFSSKQREHADRVVQCVLALESAVGEIDREGGRAMATEYERAVEAFQTLVDRCGGYAPAGQLLPHQAIKLPRLDRSISALDQILRRLRGLQQD